MSAKGSKAAERAAAQISAAMALDGNEEAGQEPAPDVQRAAGERGVLGRFDRVLGGRARVERLEIDPRRVRVWALQGRLQDSLNAESVADLVRTIGPFGQFAPAIVRPVVDDPAYTHEVIDGSRRRLACELLGKKLIAFSSDLTDLQAVMISQSADDQVKHSPYEVGLRWQGWLTAGIAKDAASLAKEIGVSTSLMSQRLNVAYAPREFLRCFGDHERVPKPIYLRLASLMSTAKMMERLDETVQSLAAKAQRVRDAGEGAKEATAALTEVEIALRPRRERAKPQVIERPATDDRPSIQVTPGKNALGIKLARGIPQRTQIAFAEAVADFAAEWLSKSLPGK